MGNTIGPSGSTPTPANVPANVEESQNTNVDADSIQSAKELDSPAQGNTEQARPPATQERPVTQRFSTGRQLSEFGLGGQMRELQLKQMIGGSTNKAVPLDAKLPAGKSDPTPETRFAGLKDQLDAAKIPAKVRDELLAQGGKKTGDELGHFMDRVDLALKSKDPAGEIKSLVMQGRIDAYKESFNSKYEVNGKTVQALPHFRIGDTGGGNTGFSGPAGRHGSAAVQEDLTKLIQTNDKTHWNDQMRNAVHMVAYGRGNAEQIQMVTQSLIRSGQFDEAKKNHPGLSDSDTIRMMQWDHGIGIDCAGYVQQAFVGVHGGDRAKYGLQPRIGDENLMYLKSNPHFKEVKPTDVKPGDLVALDPPSKGDVGHTILITDHHEMGVKLERLLYKNLSGFAGPNDKIHVYSGDASWSGGADGDLKGGVQRRVILYNETTGKWADAMPAADGGYDVQPSTGTGPYNHPMNGIYRPKGE